MMQHAVETGQRPDDPTPRREGDRGVKSDGIHSWTDAEIAQFEAASSGRHASHGWRSRCCFYTGQRRSDVVTMGQQHIDKNGASPMCARSRPSAALKTIPIHPDLQAIMDATPSEHLTFLVTQLGKPFTSAGFGNWFRDRCNEAGLPQCSEHTAYARRLRGVWPKMDARRMKSRPSPRARIGCARSSGYTKDCRSRPGWQRRRWTR